MEAVIIVFVHGAGHSEIGQFGHPIRVDQTIATGHVSVFSWEKKKKYSFSYGTFSRKMSCESTLAITNLSKLKRLRLYYYNFE